MVSGRRSSAWLVAGATCWILFEVANVYFIMPLPGSQHMRSVDLAYVIYRWRWAARVLFWGMMLYGAPVLWQGNVRPRVLPVLVTIAAGVAGWVTNMNMAADRIFLAPRSLVMAPLAANQVARDRLVVGVVDGGEARAYPLQFIGYHHQVRDSLSGKPILVSYCTVCRTGRVFRPMVDGAVESFRLVGMDHFNAMFEDATTRSWWRQANGEAVTGSLRGHQLEEVPSVQVTLEQWAAMYPRTLVMQEDPAFRDRYPANYAYERGESRSALTGTDTASWGEKSWVVGVELGGVSRAYDWNQLKRLRVINDELGGTPIAIVLAADGASFHAFRRPSADVPLEIIGDSLRSGQEAFGMNPGLQRIQASQEFWHSWRTFHPATTRYP